MSVEVHGAWVVRCDGTCKNLHITNTATVTHVTKYNSNLSEEEVLRQVAKTDWVVEDGSVYCPTCAADREEVQ
jgi:hypothetical protein